MHLSARRPMRSAAPATPSRGARSGRRQLSWPPALALLAGLLSAEGAAVVTTLALATVETSEVAVRQTLAKAHELDEAVRTGAWEIFEAMKALTDARQTAAKAIVAKVSETLAADEHAIGLKAALDDQRGKAVRLLTVAPPPPPPPPPPPHLRRIRRHLLRHQNRRQPGLWFKRTQQITLSRHKRLRCSMTCTPGWTVTPTCGFRSRGGSRNRGPRSDCGGCALVAAADRGPGAGGAGPRKRCQGHRHSGQGQGAVAQCDHAVGQALPTTLV